MLTRAHVHAHTHTQRHNSLRYLPSPTEKNDVVGGSTLHDRMTVETFFSSRVVCKEQDGFN